MEISITSENNHAYATKISRSDAFYPDIPSVVLKTSLPATLSYEQTVWSDLPNIPTLLIELLSEIDKCIPPLKYIGYGIGDYTLKHCDKILNVLLSARYESDFRKSIIHQCQRSLLAQIIVLFLLRMEDPPFIATSTLCSALLEKKISINLQTPKCDQYDANIEMIIKDCLTPLSIYQKATISYFIEKCQRWCQSEIAYQIKQNSKVEQNEVYSKLLEFLAHFFSKSLIGLPKSYISSLLLAHSNADLDNIREEIFIVLTGMISSYFWHRNSIECLCIIKRNEFNKLPTLIGSDSESDDPYNGGFLSD
ncbi:unnamed protein product [Trichobilharzia szidati]|nr:unnamed protein product [Trichobilharzia szidati]